MLFFIYGFHHFLEIVWTKFGLQIHFNKEFYRLSKILAQTVNLGLVYIHHFFGNHHTIFFFLMQISGL